MLASAGIGAVAGWSQYAIGSAFHGEDLTLLGSITAAGLGFIGGAISGAGARNSANIASKMQLTGKGASAVKAITTAANRYLAGEISMKGLQATTRLWGNIALNAVQDAIAPTITRLIVYGVITNIGVTIGTSAVNYGLSYVEPFSFFILIIKLYHTINTKRIKNRQNHPFFPDSSAYVSIILLPMSSTTPPSLVSPTASSKAPDPFPALNLLLSPVLFSHPLSSEHRTSLQISAHSSFDHRQ